MTSRKHTLSKVFAGRGDTDTEELVLFGSVRMTTLSKGEESHDSAFVAHVKLKLGSSSSSAAQPRMSSMEVYAVSFTC